MENFVPKRPGIQSSIFQDAQIVVTDKPEQKFYVGTPPKQKQEPVIDTEPTPVYDGRVIANVVRAYLSWTR